MRSILVLRGGALGDFIVTLPTLAALRRQWPGARIELAGNATAAQLARARGLLDAVHSQHEARWGALFGSDPLPREFADWLAGFDLVLSYWPDPDGALAQRFPRHEGQRFLCAPALPTRGPAASHYAEPLQRLGIPPPAPHCLITPLRPADPPAARAIAVHPGSGGRRKNWPAENWRRLIADLPPPVTLILGEVELERADEFAVPGVDLLRAPPLEDLVVHLAGCRLFLGHDSGVSHLAAACGAPCVLLFGPTDPAIWSPPAPRVRVLQCGPDLASLPVPEVRDAVRRALEDQT